MKFRELPGFFPPLFIDFVEGAGHAKEFLPCPPDAGALRDTVARVPETILRRADLCDVLTQQAELFGCGEPAFANITRLRSAGAVAVVARLRAGLLGGPLSSWLKAMTAARLAAWLSESGLDAIPVAWIDGRFEPADLGVGLLSPHGPERIRMEAGLDPGRGLPGSVGEFLARVSSVAGLEAGNGGLLAILESAYQPGIPAIQAWARMISRILAPLGIVFFDPLHPGIPKPDLDPTTFPLAVGVPAGTAELASRLEEARYDIPTAQLHSMETQAREFFFRQGLLLPIAACVIDESEIFAAALAQPVFSRARRKAPVLWPRVSATLVDERSRKLIARYGFDLRQIYLGPRSLAVKLMKELQQADPQSRVAAMQAGVREKAAELAGLVPPSDRLRKAIQNTERRMVYQLGKLSAAFSSAQQRRSLIGERHADHLCSHLAPWGHLQEREIAGIQFMVANPASRIKGIWQSIDPWKFEHQLIFL